MKVILKENIEDLGKKGDIIRVAPGYGRNYLIPKKIALEVTSTNTKMIEMVQKALLKGLEKDIATFKSLIDRLNDTTLTFERKAGEKDAIFGSVSVADIRDGLMALGIEIEKKKILLDEPIKRLGNYTIRIKVFHDERAEIKLEVNKEGAVEEPAVVADEPKPEPEAEPSEEPKPEPGPIEETQESEKVTEPEDKDSTEVPAEATEQPEGSETQDKKDE
ncbi:MAG: 50S ribosomal protein L9 [Candidatus Aminicenantes bacterium]|nr:50S ribosomal protein L9 [Candidatus Aminicenantes bacterium]